MFASCRFALADDKLLFCWGSSDGDIESYCLPGVVMIGTVSSVIVDAGRGVVSAEVRLWGLPPPSLDDILALWVPHSLTMVAIKGGGGMREGFKINEKR